MSVTLKDIAQEAGVYPSLVSAVLNDRGYTRISAERRASIKAIAERLGYRPNLQASCLRRGKQSLVGVFLPIWEDILIIELIRGLTAEANFSEVPLQFQFGMQPESYEKFLKETLKIKNNAIITYMPYVEEIGRVKTLLSSYMDDGGKVIAISSNSRTIPSTLSLDFDDALGGKLAARYLAGLGCASYATFAFYLSLAHDRCIPFTDELRLLIPEADISDYWLLSDDLRQRQENIDRLFDENRLPIGIFVAKGGDFCNYIITRGLERGLVPEKDFFIVAYDRPARYGDCYPIARILQPYYELGKMSIAKFNDLRDGTPAIPELLAPRLFVPFTQIKWKTQGERSYE